MTEPRFDRMQRWLARPWQPLTLIHNVPTQWNWVVAYPEGLTLGLFVDIGAFTYLQAQAGITIGINVQIGSHCAIYSVSTIDDTHAPVVIEDNAKIGSHTTILPGVRIGHHAVVGAHSLVKENVLPSQTVMGVPAKEKP